MYVCEREKSNSFKIHVIILRYKKLLIYHLRRILNLQNFLPKHPFSFTLETVLKMVKETNKEDVDIICAKVTEYASKKVAKAAKLI